MKSNQVFPSTYLKVDDLNKRRVALTIQTVEMEKVGEDNKPVITFKETPKKLTLNKTNWNMIEMLLGSDDSDDWAGKKISLRPDMTTYQGKPMPCIRVDSELPANGNGGKPVPVPAQTEDPFATEGNDDEIPF